MSIKRAMSPIKNNYSTSLTVLYLCTNNIHKYKRPHLKKWVLRLLWVTTGSRTSRKYLQQAAFMYIPKNESIHPNPNIQRTIFMCVPMYQQYYIGTVQWFSNCPWRNSQPFKPFLGQILLRVQAEVLTPAYFTPSSPLVKIILHK